MNENEVKNIPDAAYEAEVEEKQVPSPAYQDGLIGILNYAEPQDDEPKYRKKKKHHRKFPYFYVIYSVLVIAAVIAIVCVCSFVKVLLTEYEQVQPKYKAEEIFTEYFKDPDVSELLAYREEGFAEFDSEETIKAHITNQIKKGNITYAETQKKPNGERIYTVYSDNSRFATFSLVEGEQTTEHGFKYYVLGEKKLTVELPSSAAYSFVIPDKYSVYVNGIAAGEKYKTGESFPTDAYAISSGKIGANYIAYSINGLLATPVFSVKDENGADVKHYWDDERELYTVDMTHFTVRIPRGYIGYIEGGAIDGKYICQDKEAEASAYNKFLSQGSEGLMYIDYKINGFYPNETPSVTVKSADGFDAKVEYETDQVGERVFSCLPAYSDAMAEEQKEILKDFFRKYTLHLMYVNVTADGEPMDRYKKKDLKPFFDASSEAWKQFYSVDPMWQFEPTRYEFVDESVTEYIVFSDGTVSCRVKQTYNSWRREAFYSQSLDKTVFLKRSGENWLIYEMTNTSAIEGPGAPEM